MIPRHFKLPGSRPSMALVVFCFALGDAARTETEPIPRLIRALQSEDPQARAEAAAALMEMGPAAMDATPGGWAKGDIVQYSSTPSSRKREGAS